MLWDRTRNDSVIDDTEQCKPLSEDTPAQSNLAPLARFDENGDIPCPLPSSPQNPDIQSCSKRYCQILTNFFFSQFSLILLVLIYITFGGLIFYLIESRYEPRKIEQIKLKHYKGIENIRRITNEEFNWMLNKSFELHYALWRGIVSRLDGYDNTGWRIQVSPERFDRLINYELARMQAEEEKLTDKHDIRTDAVYNQKWTFSTAMLYSATVITTVGYGHITPKSILGKLITCLYAMIGIPIMIIYLANTGNLFAYLFIKYYSILKNFIQRRRQDMTDKEIKQYHVPVVLTLGILFLYVLAGAMLFSYWEGWSYIDSAYFAFITFTTIGLGDLVPGKGTLTENKNGKSILCALYLLYGLVLTTMCFKLMQDDLYALRQRIFTRLGFHTYYHRYYFHYNYQHRLQLNENIK